VGKYPEPTPRYQIHASASSGLTEWLPSGFITAFLDLLWYEMKASEAKLNKRMDELREPEGATARCEDAVVTTGRQATRTPGAVSCPAHKPSQAFW